MLSCPNSDYCCCWTFGPFKTWQVSEASSLRSKLAFIKERMSIRMWLGWEGDEFRCCRCQRISLVPQQRCLFHQDDMCDKQLRSKSCQWNWHFEDSTELIITITRHNWRGVFSDMCFNFHPKNWGRWTHFDEHIFPNGLVQPQTTRWAPTSYKWGYIP